MNYELAKKLKDAGFILPQNAEYKERPNSWIHADGNYGDWKGCSVDVKSECYNPTLIELIEACGDKMFGLLRHDFPSDKSVRWRAFEKEPQGLEGYGDTPEEAVANLYLLLNK